MSLTSKNTLPKSTDLKCVLELIGWLGYTPYELHPDLPYMVGNFGWSGDKQFQSFVGVELQVYQKDGVITADTRTRVGRSFWDQKQQNKTIKAFKDFFGGSFITDEGKNIFFEEDEHEPTILESGLYLQKWIHHNAVAKLHILKQSLEIGGNDKLSDFPWMNELNPKVIYNNLQIPFLVGTWEKYLKSTFVVLLKCSSDRSKIFKKLLSKIRLLPDYMESFSQDNETVEWLLAEWLSFQRPKSVIENFQMIDGGIDINGIFMKPTEKQTEPLFDRIDHVIDIRNDIVHAGIISPDVSVEVVNQYIADFDEGTNRIYRCIGEHYNLELSDEY